MGVQRFETTKDDVNSDEVVEKDGTFLFDQINAFLDTPILDANDRSDQGAVAETLKFCFERCYFILMGLKINVERQSWKGVTLVLLIVACNAAWGRCCLFITMLFSQIVRLGRARMG